MHIYQLLELHLLRLSSVVAYPRNSVRQFVSVWKVARVQEAPRPLAGSARPAKLIRPDQAGFLMHGSQPARP